MRMDDEKGLVVAGVALLLASAVNFFGVLPSEIGTAILATVALVVFSVFLYRAGFTRGRRSVMPNGRRDRSN